jgi:hypothetical protein
MATLELNKMPATAEARATDAEGDARLDRAAAGC